MNFDIVVVGAGPAGLSLACALAPLGLSVALIDTQATEALAEPAFDGREIALTHRSRQTLSRLGIWDHIDPDAISPLRDAQVLNGPSLKGLRIGHEHGHAAELGYLVANHQIRRAAFRAAQPLAGLRWITPAQVADAGCSADQAWVRLADGRCLTARLLVAADSRYSQTRRALGIPAQMHDFGQSMLVCGMHHSQPHHHVAWEWFDYGQTLALLPMNGHRSSVVLTLPHHALQPLLQMPPEAFNQAITARFDHRLGPMELVSTRHSYPLVTTYASRFVGPCCALVGDAAVGMHPVTAHGFNLGLRSVEGLAQAVAQGLQTHQNPAEPSALRAYEHTHRRASVPLFAATHAIAKLYTDDRPPSRLLRQLALSVGERVTPFKQLVARSLTGLAPSHLR